MAYTLRLESPAYLTFTPIVLVGDFKVTMSNFNAINPASDFIRTFGEAANTNNFLLYRNDGANNAWSFRANNNTAVFTAGAAKPTLENGELTFERVGSTGTITYLGVSTSTTVSTDNFTLSGFNITNNSTSSGVFGNVVIEQASSIIYNWDFDNTDHSLTNVTETVTGNDAIGTNVSVSDWSQFFIGTQLSYNLLPNGAQAQNPSGGWTCTGLDRLSNGNWLVGNAGQAQDNGAPLTPSLVVLSSDYSTIIQELDMTPVIGNETIQGVAIGSDGTYWFASGNIGFAVNVDTSGTEIARYSIPSINGLSFDSTRGASGSLWYVEIAGTSIKRYDIALAATVGADTIPSSQATVPDQVHYKGDLIYLTNGASGVDGDVYIFDAVTKAEFAYIRPLSQAQAIEGVYVEGQTLYIANDGGYHTNATPATSAIIEYSVDFAAELVPGEASGSSSMMQFAMMGVFR